MIKVFLILSSAVLIGAGVLGWMNREEFIEVRTNKDENIKQVSAKVTETIKANEVLVEKFNILNATHAEYDEAVLATKGHSNNIIGQDRLLSEAMGKKSKLMEEKAEYDRALAELDLRFKGVDFDTLPDRINEMKADLVDKQKMQEELTKQVAAMNKRVDNNLSTINTFQAKQSDRSVGISLNGTEGTITAVNQDWGFVVINIGKNQGVTADSELIVKRGAEIVGKLTIGSIEPRLTVADIRLNTLKKGARILPGDRVIFEKLQN